jgi:hypothetical protein
MALNLPFSTKDITDRITGNDQKPINQFVSHIKSGALSRTNRYAVLFTPPQGINPGNLQKILLFCDQIQLPGTNYSTTQNRTFGEFREVPYEKLYDNITMSFYVDVDMKVKSLFDDWSNLISNPVTKTYNYYNDYITDMVIEVQDINDKTRYEMTLFECYPKTISSIQMDYASKDVMKISIGMQYKNWMASPKSPLTDGQKVPTNFFDKMTQNFTGFQETINNTLGTRAGNFLTGSALSYGVTKLPGLLKF